MLSNGPEGVLSDKYRWWLVRLQVDRRDHDLIAAAGRGAPGLYIVRSPDLAVAATKLVKEFYRRSLSRLPGEEPGSIRPPHESCGVREACNCLKAPERR